MRATISLVFLCLSLQAEPPLQALAPPITLMPASAARATDPVKLDTGSLYVISCRVKCDILAFPEGVISSEEKTGPRDFTAKFPGSDDYQDKSLPGPFLYVLKATGTGTASIVVIPVGYKDKSEWVKLAVEANGKKKEEKKTDPKPDPMPGPYTGKGRIAVIEETADAANNRGQFFSNEALMGYIRSKCSHRPRIVDQHAVDETGKPPKDMAPWLELARGKKLPQIFVTSPDGTVLFSGDLPKTPELLLAKLKEIFGE